MRSKNIILLILFLLFSAVAQAGVTFDAADDAIDLGSSQDNLSKITISAWVYPTSMGEGNIGTIWIKDAAGTTRKDFRFNAANNLFFRIGRATTSETVSTPNNALPNGAWAHVAAVWDGTLDDAANDIKIYINGVLQTATSPANGSGAVTDDASATEHIGNRAGDTQTWDGIIGDFALWADELTATQIFALASSRTKRMPLQINPSTLKIYLPLDEVPNGKSADGVTFVNLKSPGTSNGVGGDGSNNTGLTSSAEAVLSYPGNP